MEKKNKYIHLINGEIKKSNFIHPFNNKKINDLKNKEFYIKKFKQDLGKDCSYEDISNGRNNLFKCSIKNEQFNIFIEHCDSGGRDTSQKVGIPFQITSFGHLIKNFKNVLVVDMYFELSEDSNKNLTVNQNKYCYAIVIPSEIYSSEVTYNVISGNKKPNQSSRWISLKNINDCIKNKINLVNSEGNVWIVHPDNLRTFLFGVVLGDYKEQFNKSIVELLKTIHDKMEGKSPEDREIAKLRKDLRKEIINRNKCEIISCGCNIDECLVASHIWPVNKILDSQGVSWENKKKYVRDPNNAFLLCGTHDKLLDRFLISFDDGGKLIYSKLLSNSIKYYNFGDISKPVIKINNENLFYLKKHRQIFNELEIYRQNLI